ncbi:glycosyltransferase [Paenibacillus protaetiae]|uniref:DUF11 domain-containing protein n=1 Tax=Paenibacillus protaetiae TaxID=2509456 RepID=A0A4P6EX36_9BACL|nr:glycosyltransferase [Paenibacillus protaetiae]QAY67592.1 DUF11 domain-containing protein [Paenibacillus protaetiae]
MIELAMTFHDRNGKYTEHAGVVLASVFKNTKSPINVHILHDESLNEVNKFRLVELARRYKHDIYFYSVTLPDDLLAAAEAAEKVHTWSLASIYRLMLPKLIMKDKTLYLDCDLLVTMDITDLWKTDLGRHYLAATWDQGILQVADEVAVFGLDPAVYFNSGVILFDLDNIRKKEGWYEDILTFLRTYPKTTLPDQDILNSVFGKQYLPMPERFNTFVDPDENISYEDKILHFAGELKCWDPQSPGFPLYSHYREFTPWGSHTGEDADRTAHSRIEGPPVMIDKFVSPAQARPGETVWFNLEVRNESGADLTGVRLTDSLRGTIEWFDRLAAGASLWLSWPYMIAKDERPGSTISSTTELKADTIQPLQAKAAVTVAAASQAAAAKFEEAEVNFNFPIPIWPHLRHTGITTRPLLLKKKAGKKPKPKLTRKPVAKTKRKPKGKLKQRLVPGARLERKKLAAKKKSVSRQPRRTVVYATPRAHGLPVKFIKHHEPGKASA